MPGNPNFASLDTTTYDAISAGITDVITAQEAMLSYAEAMGSKREYSGGRNIREDLMFSKNTTFKAINPTEEVDMGATDPLTTAIFSWRVYAGSMTSSLLEQAQNSGKPQIINLLKSRVTNLVTSAKLALDLDLFSDGTDPKKIQGLQFLVEDGTSYQTVGNIDSSVYSVWQNQWIGTAGNGYANLLKLMRKGRIRARRDGIKIDLWVGDADAREAYESFCTMILRIPLTANKVMADLGFDSVDYVGAALINEPGVPAGYMWGLAMQTIHWCVLTGSEFELTPLVQPYNQLAASRLCYTFCALTSNHRAPNLLINGLTY